MAEWYEELWDYATDAGNAVADTVSNVASNVADTASTVYNNYVAPAVSTAWDVAKENPLATAGVIHGLTSGGDFGQRLTEAAKWGGAGYLGDQALGTSNWSWGSGTPGMSAPTSLPTSSGASGPLSGSAWNNAGTGAMYTGPASSVTVASSPAATGGDFGGMHAETTQAAGGLPSMDTNPNYYDRIPNASNSALSTGASSSGLSTPAGLSMSGNPNAYDRVTNASNTNLPGAAYTADMASKVGGPAAEGGSGVLDKMNAGLKTVRDTSQKYGDLVGLGIKGYAALQGQEQGKKADEYLRRQEERQTQADEANKGIVDKQNTLTQQRADEYQAMDPQFYAAKAYSDVMGRQSRAANANAQSEMNRGYSAATAAANKRRAMLGASTGATTAAEAARSQREGTRMAGLSGIKYSTYSPTPFNNTMYEAIANSGNAQTEGAVKFFDDLTGLQTGKAKEQVQQDQIPR